MKNSLFDFSDYRAYLNHKLSTKGATRGLRTELAEKTNTKLAFISRVLHGTAELSPEHIPPTNKLLGHNKNESHYFAILVLRARAGSADLESYYDEQIEEILKKREVLQNLIDLPEVISESSQSKYYSQWYYLPVHVLVAIPIYQTKEAIAARLGLSVNIVKSTLDELVKMGLVEHRNGRYITGKRRIQLSKDSVWSHQAHTHFRHRAIHKIATQDPEALHYSVAVSMSKSLYKEYRKKLLDLLIEFEEELKDSRDEELFALNLDFFKY